MSLDSPYFRLLRDKINEYGGIHNAHLHIDRSGTYFESLDGADGLSVVSDYKLSLHEKHQQIGDIHSSIQFEKSHLLARVNYYLDAMIHVNTRRADTVIDVTDDKVGLSTIETLIELKHQRKAEIDLHLGAYTPMGFRDDQPRRWELFETAANQADFIGSLPERDDKNRYPEHIGFYENCVRVLELSMKLNKPVQMHLDQHSDPRESETEIFLRAVDDVGYPSFDREEPMLWAIHFISPRHYEDTRRSELLDRMASQKVGVICCPSAALSMRQLRLLQSPVGNSIAPILEMLGTGVQVRLGSDNIADVCSPAGTPDLVDEVYVLCNALRFYDIDILAKLVSGHQLNDADRQLVLKHLAEDHQQIQSAMDYRAPI